MIIQLLYSNIININQIIVKIYEFIIYLSYVLKIIKSVSITNFIIKM